MNKYCTHVMYTNLDKIIKLIELYTHPQTPINDNEIKNKTILKYSHDIRLRVILSICETIASAATKTDPFRSH